MLSLSPYKSRMDVKDASTNDPSLPLIYYSVNDYERMDLHVKLSPNEYLCVELSCIYPTDLKESGLKKEDDGPFENPLPGFGKTVLFQGAVPYTSLQQVYGQKAGGGMRAIRNSVGGEARREYVMMRGPNGKGQCQVSVTEPPPKEVLGDQADSWGDRIRRIGSAVVKATGAALLEGSGGVGAGEGGELECSMTYVNVPWQSIVLDLIKDLSET
jgi:hypothetical protein